MTERCSWSDMGISWSERSSDVSNGDVTRSGTVEKRLWKKQLLNCWSCQDDKARDDVVSTALQVGQHCTGKQCEGRPIRFHERKKSDFPGFLG